MRLNKELEGLSTTKDGKVRNSLFSGGLSNRSQKKNEKEMPASWYVLKEDEKGELEHSDEEPRSSETNDSDGDKETGRNSSLEYDEQSQNDHLRETASLFKPKKSTFSQFGRPQKNNMAGARIPGWRRQSSSLHDIRVFKDRHNLMGTLAVPIVGSPSSASGMTESEESQSSVTRLAIFNLEDFQKNTKKERRQTVMMSELKDKKRRSKSKKHKSRLNDQEKRKKSRKKKKKRKERKSRVRKSEVRASRIEKREIVDEIETEEHSEKRTPTGKQEKPRFGDDIEFTDDEFESKDSERTRRREERDERRERHERRKSKHQKRKSRNHKRKSKKLKSSKRKSRRRSRNIDLTPDEDPEIERLERKKESRPSKRISIQPNIHSEARRNSKRRNTNKSVSFNPKIQVEKIKPNRNSHSQRKSKFEKHHESKPVEESR